MKHPNVTLHFNTADARGEKDVIVIAGSAFIDPNAPPAHKLPAYLKKYKTGIAELNLAPEGMGDQYSVAIRVKAISVRGW
jgi:hypothetical protein